jgi:hypothetical protein
MHERSGFECTFENRKEERSRETMSMFNQLTVYQNAYSTITRGNIRKSEE